MIDLHLLDLTSKAAAYTKSLDEDAKLYTVTHSVTDRNTMINKVKAISDITKSIIEAIVCSGPTLEDDMEQYNTWQQSFMQERRGKQ
jgi:hypothetical protein